MIANNKGAESDCMDAPAGLHVCLQFIVCMRQSCFSHRGASTRENLSSGVCKQQRPACTCAQSDQRLCYSLIGKNHLSEDLVGMLSVQNLKMQQLTCTLHQVILFERIIFAYTILVKNYNFMQK